MQLSCENLGGKPSPIHLKAVFSNLVRRVFIKQVSKILRLPQNIAGNVNNFPIFAAVGTVELLHETGQHLRHPMPVLTFIGTQNRRVRMRGSGRGYRPKRKHSDESVLSFLHN